MAKNWLIRTKTNHILGPISKEKVLELLQNGSIKDDDEVCAGNGFWFYIREDDMVARFLLGRELQNFNPISEAKDVLTFPQQTQVQEEDITMVGGFDIKRLNEKTPPSGTVFKTMPDMKPPTPEPKKKIEITRSHAPVRELPPKPLKPKGPKAQLQKQNYLQYLAILSFLILLAALWYRRAIFRYLKNSDDFTFVLIEKVYAQEEAPAEKKK